VIYRKTYRSMSDLSSLLEPFTPANPALIHTSASLPSGAGCPEMSGLGGRSVRFYPDMKAASGHLKTGPLAPSCPYLSRFAPTSGCPICPALTAEEVAFAPVFASAIRSVLVVGPSKRVRQGP
jgi:hypothetical protein